MPALAAAAGSSLGLRTLLACALWPGGSASADRWVWRKVAKLRRCWHFYGEPPFGCRRCQLRSEGPRRLFYGLIFGGYDEDQLEALLFEAQGLVHRVVVVEADHTLQGERRSELLPGLFAEGGRLAAYRSFVVPHRLAFRARWRCRSDAAACEWEQRQATLAAAVNAGMERGRDVFVVADADELLSKEALVFLAYCEFGPPPLAIVMPHHVYSLRWEYHPWEDVLAAAAEFWLDTDQPLAHFRQLGPKAFEKLFPYNLTGWHLSFFGGVHAVKQKLLSYGHPEYNNAPYTDRSFIEQGIRSGEEPFRRGPLYDSEAIRALAGIGGIPRRLPAMLGAPGARPSFACWLDALGSACRGQPVA